MRLIPPRHLTFLRAICLTLPLLISAAGDALAQAGTASPASEMLDLEFWKSADRLATPAAYKAYLDRFPNGLFAPLAREALQKLTVAQPAQPPATTPPTPPATPATAGAAASARVTNTAPAHGAPAGALRHFNEPSQSGALEHPVGSRFNGPGPLTVGSLGARKQLVLPAGEWVLLAATDHNDIEAGTLAPVIPLVYRVIPLSAGSIKLSTVSFGRFEGGRLASLLVTMFNRAAFNGARTSAPGEACEGNQAPRLYYLKDGPVNRRMCVMTTLLADPLGANGAELAPASAVAELGVSLRRLEATVQGPGLATLFHYAGQTDGWLRVTRVDYPQVQAPLAALGARDWAALGIPDAKDRSAPALYVEQLRGWAQTYAARAHDGWRRNLETPEIEPGQAARNPASLPDFNPVF